MFIKLCKLKNKNAKKNTRTLQQKKRSGCVEQNKRLRDYNIENKMKSF